MMTQEFQRKIVDSYMVTPRLLEALRKFAKKKKMSKSEVIRQALEQFMK